MEYLRINFNQLFNFQSNGSLEPKARIRVGKVEFGPGFRFSRGVKLGGVDLFSFWGKDVAVYKDGDVWVMAGYYD